MYRYTICFCLHDESVLMLYRHRPPHQLLWNGIGGKIESGESPLISVFREVAEEAAIDLGLAKEVRFAGVVTWPVQDRKDQPLEGMYAYIARLAGQDEPRTGDREIPEGILSWKPIQWVCDPGNNDMAKNIPSFLPLMLTGNAPMHYQCRYMDGQFLDVHVSPLETEIS